MFGVYPLTICLGDRRPGASNSSRKTVVDQAFDGERGNAKAESGSSHALCRAKKRREAPSTLHLFAGAPESARLRFIDENGGGPGVRLRKPPKQKRRGPA